MKKELKVKLFYLILYLKIFFYHSIISGKLKKKMRPLSNLNTVVYDMDLLPEHLCGDPKPFPYAQKNHCPVL